MSSRFRELLAAAALVAAALLLAAFAPPAFADARAPLRVCADPDNLPYSRADGRGFEVAVARVVAQELGRPLEIAWVPQGRGFVRKSLGADLCDVLPGVPAGFERVLATRPYYRSSYVIVTRADAAAPLMSMDDPRIADLAIGIQLVGDEPSTTPPGLALADRGAAAHVVGYPLMGETPSAERATADLAAGRLDAAILWGPQAGWFATHSPVALRIARAMPPAGSPLRFEFAIAMGVRRGDTALRDALDAALQKRAADIAAILDAHAVPRWGDAAEAHAAASFSGARP